MIANYIVKLNHISHLRPKMADNALFQLCGRFFRLIGAEHNACQSIEHKEQGERL